GHDPGSRFHQTEELGPRVGTRYMDDVVGAGFDGANQRRHRGQCRRSEVAKLIQTNRRGAEPEVGLGALATQLPGVLLHPGRDATGIAEIAEEQYPHCVSDLEGNSEEPTARRSGGRGASYMPPV